MTTDHIFLPDEAITLAEILSAGGYQTVGITTSPNVNRSNGLAQGFAVWHEILFSVTDPLSNRLLVGAANRFVRDRWGMRFCLADLLPTLEPDKGAVDAIRTLFDWFRCDYEPSRPFFAFVNLFEAHWPYGGPAWARRLFLNEREMQESYAVDVSRGRVLLPSQRAGGDMPVLRKMYQSGVRCQDEQLKSVLAYLRLSGLLDSTMVVIVSDHGEHLGEHGLWEHYEGPYQTVAHVPLIIRYPAKFPAGKRVPHVVQGADLFCTVLSVTGRELPSSLYMPLRDLSDLANAANWSESGVTDFSDGTADGEPQPMWGLREGTWKLIEGPRSERQLYDLIRDPAELSDLWKAKRRLGRRLEQSLGDWRTTATRQSIATTQPAPPVPEEQRQRLRDLGYTQ